MNGRVESFATSKKASPSRRTTRRSSPNFESTVRRLSTLRRTREPSVRRMSARWPASVANVLASGAAASSEPAGAAGPKDQSATSAATTASVTAAPAARCFAEKRLASERRACREAKDASFEDAFFEDAPLEEPVCPGDPAGGIGVSSSAARRRGDVGAGSPCVVSSCTRSQSRSVSHDPPFSEAEDSSGAADGCQGDASLVVRQTWRSSSRTTSRAGSASTQARTRAASSAEHSPAKYLANRLQLMSSLTVAERIRG